jgi:hypothetical protein
MRHNGFKVDIHFNSSIFNSFGTIPMIKIYDHSVEGRYEMKFTYNQIGGGLASPYEIDGINEIDEPGFEEFLEA